jgi:hypothetical protein
LCNCEGVLKPLLSLYTRINDEEQIPDERLSPSAIVPDQSVSPVTAISDGRLMCISIFGEDIRAFTFKTKYKESIVVGGVGTVKLTS